MKSYRASEQRTEAMQDSGDESASNSTDIRGELPSFRDVFGGTTVNRELGEAIVSAMNFYVVPLWKEMVNIRESLDRIETKLSESPSGIQLDGSLSDAVMVALKKLLLGLDLVPSQVTQLALAGKVLEGKDRENFLRRSSDTLSKQRSKLATLIMKNPEDDTQNIFSKWADAMKISPRTLTERECKGLDNIRISLYMEALKKISPHPRNTLWKELSKIFDEAKDENAAELRKARMELGKEVGAKIRNSGSTPSSSVSNSAPPSNNSATTSSSSASTSAPTSSSSASTSAHTSTRSSNRPGTPSSFSLLPNLPQFPRSLDTNRERETRKRRHTENLSPQTSPQYEEYEPNYHSDYTNYSGYNPDFSDDR